MVILAKELDRDAVVVENARRVEVRTGRERRRRKDIFRCVACVILGKVFGLDIRRSIVRSDAGEYS